MRDVRATEVRREEEEDDGWWVVPAGQGGRAVRFDAPASVAGESGEAWIEVRPLTYREALERESLGVFEEYALSDGGRVLSVCRRYDFWAMAEYDFRTSVVGFCLPEIGPDGVVRMRRRGEEGEGSDVSFLAAMGPALASWVQDCIDVVNLRHESGRVALGEAKKNCGS